MGSTQQASAANSHFGDAGSRSSTGREVGAIAHHHLQQQQQQQDSSSGGVLQDSRRMLAYMNAEGLLVRGSSLWEQQALFALAGGSAQVADVGEDLPFLLGSRSSFGCYSGGGPSGDERGLEQPSPSVLEQQLHAMLQAGSLGLPRARAPPSVAAAAEAAAAAARSLQAPQGSPQHGSMSSSSTIHMGALARRPSMQGAASGEAAFGAGGGGGTPESGG